MKDPIEDLLREFADRVRAVVHAETFSRISGALGGSGLTPKATRAKQLCPVPGCTNTAVPRYGMACMEHKGLPKGEIQKYREARKATKNGQLPVLPVVVKGRKKRAAVPVA